MNVLIEFYDPEEPILNLISCMAMKPDICVYVGEEKIRRQKSQRSLQNTLKIAGINTSLRFIAVNIFDFEEIRSALQQVLDEYSDMHCIVDVSGGNDLLLLAAGMCCAAYEVEIVNHKLGGNFLSWICGKHAGQRLNYDIHLTREQTIAMAGGELLRHGHVEPQDITDDILAVIPEVFRRAIEMGIVVLDADDLYEDVLYKKLKTLCHRWDQ